MKTRRTRKPTLADIILEAQARKFAEISEQYKKNAEGLLALAEKLSPSQPEGKE